MRRYRLSRLHVPATADRSAGLQHHYPCKGHHPCKGKQGLPVHTLFLRSLQTMQGQW